MSMSRGGSKRGGDRGEYQQDGWNVAGGASNVPRPPPKAGDLSKFGKISSNTSAPMTFGPASVFSGKKEGKKETLSRANSNSNMFSMLSGNTEVAADTTAAKGSRPPSRKTSVDFSQTGVPEPLTQRKRLVLQPRSKPVEEAGPAPTTADSDSSSEEDEQQAPAMSDAEAKKRIEEDSKEFYAVRNLEEAEVYFSKIPAEHHTKLVDKLVSMALESKEADAQLVADFFAIASSKELCSPESFEAGFSDVAEFLEDVAIDAPMAPKLMAIMIKGPSFDEEALSRIAAKSGSHGDSLLSS